MKSCMDFRIAASEATTNRFFELSGQQPEEVEQGESSKTIIVEEFVEIDLEAALSKNDDNDDCTAATTLPPDSDGDSEPTCQTNCYCWNNLIATLLSPTVVGIVAMFLVLTYGSMAISVAAIPFISQYSKSIALVYYNALSGMAFIYTAWYVLRENRVYISWQRALKALLVLVMVQLIVDVVLAENEAIRESPVPFSIITTGILQCILPVPLLRYLYPVKDSKDKAAFRKTSTIMMCLMLCQLVAFCWAAMRKFLEDKHIAFRCLWEMTFMLCKGATKMALMNVATKKAAPDKFLFLNLIADIILTRVQITEKVAMNFLTAVCLVLGNSIAFVARCHGLVERFKVFTSNTFSCFKKGVTDPEEAPAESTEHQETSIWSCSVKDACQRKLALDKAIGTANEKEEWIQVALGNIIDGIAVIWIEITLIMNQLPTMAVVRAAMKTEQLDEAVLVSEIVWVHAQLYWLFVAVFWLFPIAFYGGKWYSELLLEREDGQKVSFKVVLVGTFWNNFAFFFVWYLSSSVYVVLPMVKQFGFDYRGED